jgi:hypothetical protein
MILSRNIVLISVAAVLLLGWFAVSRFSHVGAASMSPSTIVWRQAAPTTTVMDAEEIFKRAFWRRPAKDTPSAWCPVQRSH